MENYNKFSLCLLFIHWIDCDRTGKVTAQEIMDAQNDKDRYHDVGYGKGVTLNEKEIQDILDSLVGFGHLIKEPDETYTVKPLGACLRNVDSPKAEYLKDFHFDRIPVGGEVVRTTYLVE